VKCAVKVSTRECYFDMPTGTGATVYSSTFGRDGLRVQIYFGDADGTINRRRFEALHAKKDQFEQALGETAEWDDKPDKRAAAVYFKSSFDVKNEDQWPAMLDWLVDQHVRFRHAIEAVGGMRSLD
jgi:hypothetical protein